VVHDADDLSPAQMQLIAQWTNLSETTFLLRPTEPQADYRVRIFTPAAELAFAGHPTLGSCQAWLQRQAGALAKRELTQQCEAGLIRIRVDGRYAAFAAPPLRREPPGGVLLGQVCAALGLDAAQVQHASWLDNGTAWLGLVLDSAQTVLAIAPNQAALAGLCKVGVIGRHAPSATLASEPKPLFETRAFAACAGVPEDPVTGSLNASLAVWMDALGLTPAHYVVAQGSCIGRLGRVSVSKEEQAIWIGGQTSVCMTGQLVL
jgi:PhzF family phenazine biosynthesis protein